MEEYASVMGYLDEKISRLTPTQQKEVEDYIDFLLERGQQGSGMAGRPPSPDIIIARETGHHEEIVPLTDVFTTQEKTLIPESQIWKEISKKSELLDWLD
jgi:hypothetical protein